jgi:hypothetical protein
MEGAVGQSQMPKKPYRVHVIVDPAFGEQLRGVPPGEPVWIVDTKANRAAYEMVGKERHPESYLVGLSIFKADPKASPEDWLISELPTIDDHHGEWSHDPPWSIIHVIGAKWTERIQKELSALDFEGHQDTPEGFMAMKRFRNQEPPK